MKSVVVNAVSKAYLLNRKNYNFKELLRSEVFSLFSPKRESKETAFYALRNVTFELDKGDVLGIIGDNGAGKSTLLKIISGVSQPSEGEVRIEGKISSILEIGTGFHLELTGRENIFLSGSILGMSRSEIQRQYSNIVKFSDLGDFINVPIKRYSSGMYLRLAFSVLAHLSTDVILLDEIIYVGDAEFRMKSYNKIKQLATSGKTILIVSHDLNSISDLCTKCLLLENGEVKVFGNTGEIVRQYLDKALMKYMNFSDKEQQDKTNEELEHLQGRIEDMERVILEKERSISVNEMKEQELVNELNRLKAESEELVRIRKAMEVKSAEDNYTSQVSEKHWETETLAPGNEIVRLKKISIAAKSKKVPITQEEDILIEIQYWKYVETPLTIGILVAFNFSQLAFGTSSSFGTDTPLNNEGTGLHTSYCLINKYLLNHGVFSFSIFFLNPEGQRIYALQNAVFLKVERLPDLYEKFNYKGNLIAPFAPNLKWW